MLRTLIIWASCLLFTLPYSTRAFDQLYFSLSFGCSSGTTSKTADAISVCSAQVKSEEFRSFLNFPGSNLRSTTASAEIVLFPLFPGVRVQVQGLSRTASQSETDNNFPIKVSLFDSNKNCTQWNSASATQKTPCFFFLRGHYWGKYAAFKLSIEGTHSKSCFSPYMVYAKWPYGSFHLINTDSFITSQSPCTRAVTYSDSLSPNGVSMCFDDFSSGKASCPTYVQEYKDAIANKDKIEPKNTDDKGESGKYNNVWYGLGVVFWIIGAAIGIWRCWARISMYCCGQPVPPTVVHVPPQMGQPFPQQAMYAMPTQGPYASGQPAYGMPPQGAPYPPGQPAYGVPPQGSYPTGPPGYPQGAYAPGQSAPYPQQTPYPPAQQSSYPPAPYPQNSETPAYMSTPGGASGAPPSYSLTPEAAPLLPSAPPPYDTKNDKTNLPYPS